MKKLKIVFMGTPGFAVGVLRCLVESDHEVVGVITAPDKPAGRGRKFRQSAVKEFALEHKLHILQPKNLKDPEFLDELKELNADVQVVVAFRMLPKIVWAMPPLGTFNLHASLLPQYRGAAPINWAIINRETKTGVTTFFIDDKIDTGEIILREAVAIDTEETAGSLHDKLMNTGSKLVINTLDLIATGKVTTEAQPEEGGLKEAPKLNSGNTRINWNDDGEKIEALIRGLFPYPVAWTELYNGGDPVKMKIHKAKFIPVLSEVSTGTIVAGKSELQIALSDGYLVIEELQLPGKRKMNAKELLNGYSFIEDANVS